MMNRIKIEIHADREILILDFSGCKEAEMIEMMIEFRKMIIDGNKRVLALAIFGDKNYITPKFMHAFKKVKRDEVIPLIEKQAVVGLTETRKMILKGYNLFFNRDIKAFDSKEIAIKYLVSANV